MLKIVIWHNKPPLRIWPLWQKPALQFGKVGVADEWITDRSQSHGWHPESLRGNSFVLTEPVPCSTLRANDKTVFFFCYKSILRKIRPVAEPRVPKFRSDLSDRLKDIAGKQVPAKLKPIVVSCWSNLTLTISQWTIPSSPFRAHERHSWHPHCWCWSNDAGRAACPLEMQLFPKNPLPVPHRTTSLQIITSNYRQTMAHYRQIPGMYMGFTIKEFRRYWRFTDKPGLFIAYYRR